MAASFSWMAGMCAFITVLIVICFLLMNQGIIREPCFKHERFEESLLSSASHNTSPVSKLSLRPHNLVDLNRLCCHGAYARLTRPVVGSVQHTPSADSSPHLRTVRHQ